MGSRLEDKVAIITGSGSGIGKAMAGLFCKEGAMVVVVDLVPERVDQTVSELKTIGCNVVGMKLDLTEPKNIDKMIDETKKEFDRIDILCNNAGIMDGMFSVVEVSEGLLNKVIEVNLIAPFRATRKVIPVMLEQRGGVILNTSSVAGLFGGRAGVAYTMSKHALIGLTKHVAAVYGVQGIRCNAMAPGGVETPMGVGVKEPSKVGMGVMEKLQPTRPPSATPLQIANVAIFLVSDESSYINGHIVVVDNGWTVY